MSWGAASVAVLALIIAIWVGASALVAPSPAVGAGDLTLAVLWDDNPFHPRLPTDHGFAVLIEGLERTILFDTGGYSARLLENMSQLGLDPRKIDVVILSHEHPDHFGGLIGLLDIVRGPKVYVPSSFSSYFKQRFREAGADVFEIRRATEVIGGAFSTGELGDIVLEQALVLKTAEGLTIITGCAHPGLVNIITKARTVVGGEIHLVMGGFHHGGMTAAQIREVIAQLRTQGVRKVGPGHCTGDTSRRLLREEYGTDFVEIGVGRILKLGGTGD